MLEFVYNIRMRIATNKEQQQWNNLLANNPDGGEVFQAQEYAEVKQFSGWKPHYLISSTGVAITVQAKNVPFLGMLWHVPRGPGIANTGELLPLVNELKEYVKTNHKQVFAIKIEPAILETDENLSALTGHGLIKVRAIQPNHSTVIVDTSGSVEDVLMSLNQKGRHAIRRAERDGVIAKPVDCTTESMQAMYKLLCDTAAGKFNTRPESYYYAYWKLFAENGTGQLFFAYVEGKIVAGAYAMYIGKKGTYKDGASVHDRTVYGASHLLQWEVIKWMMARGVTEHDLCATPHSRDIRDESNPYYGLGRFKTSFSKQVTDFVGAYDIVLKPLTYRLWSPIGASLTVRLNSLIHHQYWY